LRFGTSGLRDTVENMTDMECYINTRGFVSYLKNTGEFNDGDSIALAGDRRPSTPRIKRAVAAAVRDSGGVVDDQGLVPSPALAYYAMKRGIPSIMVTGSHIPADRNGIKFTKISGEVLKSDEEGILAAVAAERKKVYRLPEGDSLFDEKGMFNTKASSEVTKLLKEDEYEGVAAVEYIERYKEAFKGMEFPFGTKLFLYQHSAVGRDILREIFESIGAEIVAPDEDIDLEYSEETGKKTKSAEPLRSKDFVPVDTESVSDKTLSVFKKVMNDRGIDIGMSMDGDSDRPLLVYRVYKDGRPTEEVKYVTGDILGLLTLLSLEDIGVAIDAACIPVSANDAILKVLEEKGVELTLTKIGSPYVIDAMNASKRGHEGPWNVFSWESNGGFLTGADLDMNGKTLKVLPTRDAALPLIMVIMYSMRQKVPVSELLDRLPRRFTHADRKKEFPVETSRAIIEFFSPKEERDVRQVDFKDDSKASVVYSDGRTREVQSGSEFHRIKDGLEKVFKEKEGFSKVKGINYIDGIRIFFANGEISHLRPSGNAPEFRNYAIADTPERAKEIVEIGIRDIIPGLARMASRKKE